MTLRVVHPLRQSYARARERLALGFGRLVPADDATASAPTGRPVSIRSRLLLLALAWVLPAVAAGLLMAYYSALAERDANLRMLRETARALSLVVEREIQQRVAIGRLLAESRSLDQLPELDDVDRTRFIAQARGATEGMFDWVELRDGRGLLLSSARAAPTAQAPQSPHAPPSAAMAQTPPPRATVQAQRLPSPALLHDRALITPQQVQPDGVLRASIVTPVYREGRLVANVVVTLLPRELQRVVNDLAVPQHWVASVIDSAHIIAARYPGGEGWAGQQVAPELLERLRAESEALFEAETADGLRQVGYYSTSTPGWTFLVSMPHQQFGGFVAGYLLRMGIGGLVMLALAVAGALWVSRGIVACIVTLERAAARLHDGQEVPARRMPIRECDAVMDALAKASTSIRQAHGELERQVDDAVRRTRAAEQQASQGQRIEALGRLTGGVAHDFNNLLGVIANSTRLVQRHADAEPALRMPVSAMLRAVESGQRLTQHLLRFAGRRPVHMQTLQLQHHLPELVEMVESAVGQRIEVGAQVDAATRAVKADASELELALINLAINARDAMPQGGRLEIGARNAAPGEAGDLPPRDYVAITVRDNGTGMDPQVGDRVFEPFFTTKTVGRGTGLGLSQVHGFCTQAGGTARISSAAGQGTTVTMLLPADGTGASGTAGSSTANGAEGTAAGTGGEAPPAAALAQARVLLVEDNEALAEVTQALLAEHGGRITHAADASAALDRLAAPGAVFDVVLTDVVMPGPLDGLALAKRLRAERPGLPVVLMSGYSDALRDAAGFALLRKPYTEADLLVTLQAALGRHRPQAHRVP
ncbi:MAG: response regulator [Rubrivivax sp.]|nr:response regulator [Rubrivivax sp.]